MEIQDLAIFQTPAAFLIPSNLLSGQDLPSDVILEDRPGRRVLVF